MEDVMKKSGTILTVVVPGEVDHCFADNIRETLDRRLQTEDILELRFDFAVRGLWTAPESDF